LLDRKNLEHKLEDWRKIMFMEDVNGNIHLKNLSVNECLTEQDGIDFLMMGNFTKQVFSIYFLKIFFR